MRLTSYSSGKTIQKINWLWYYLSITPSCNIYLEPTLTL